MHGEDKTQCQLCKRLTGPIITLFWSNMVWKRVSPMDVVARGQLTAFLLCIRSFLAWLHPNTQTNIRVILVQACSWPVRRQYFAKFELGFHLASTRPLFCNLLTAPKCSLPDGVNLSWSLHLTQNENKALNFEQDLNNCWPSTAVWPYLAEIAKSGRFQHRTSTNMWTWEITTFVEIQMEVATH